MQLRYYLGMLLRGWWIIALTSLTALILALTSAYRAQPQYRTSARFLVSPSSLVDSQSDLFRSLDVLDRRSIVSTYAEVLNSQSLFQETAQSLGIPDADLSAYKALAVVLPEANALEMNVTGPDPALVSLLCNSVGQRAIDKVNYLYKVYNLQFIDAAAAPTAPFSPKPARDASLALVLGLAIGAVLAITREQIRIPLATLRQRTVLDSVTQVYTQRHFEQLVGEHIATHTQDEALSAGLVELNGLQALKESLPQPMYRILLRQITQVLRNELRGSDIIGRWNDTTFAVLLPGTADEAAQQTMNRIQQRLSTPFTAGFEDEQIDLFPHSGIATYQQGDTITALMQRAEQILHTFEHEQNQTSHLTTTHESI